MYVCEDEKTDTSMYDNETEYLIDLEPVPPVSTLGRNSATICIHRVLLVTKNSYFYDYEQGILLGANFLPQEYSEYEL